MPCFDAEAAKEDYRKEQEFTLAKKMEAVLCAVTKELGPQAVVDAMSKHKDSGVTITEFLTWWRAHEKTDAEREDAQVVIKVNRVLEDVLVLPANFTNRRGLVFSEAALLKAIETFNTVADRRGGIVGELNPSSRFLSTDTPLDRHRKMMSIDEAGAAIKTRNLRLIPNIGMVGDIEILNTPMGKIVSVLASDTVYPPYTAPIEAFSIGLRSMVDVDSKQSNVVTNCIITTIDILPPHPKEPEDKHAWMAKLLEEANKTNLMIKLRGE